MTAKLATQDECIVDRPKEAGTIRFDCGYLSPHFITDPERMEVAFENAYVLIHERGITSKEDLIPLLEKIAHIGKPLLIIAEDVGGEVLAALVVSKLRGPLQVAAVRAPGCADQIKGTLQEIARLTGGKSITGDISAQLRETQVSDLGQATHIVIEKNRTLVKGRANSSQASLRA